MPPTTYTYLEMGMRMELKVARCSAFFMGETSNPGHLDLPGNGHENGAKGCQVLSISHWRDQCPGPLRLIWQWS